MDKWLEKYQNGGTKEYKPVVDTALVGPLTRRIGDSLISPTFEKKYGEANLSTVLEAYQYLQGIMDKSGEASSEENIKRINSIYPRIGLQKTGFWNETQKALAPIQYEDGGFLGTTNKGNAYNSSWGGQFQEGGKLHFLQPDDEKLPEGRIHPFYYQPSSELASSIGGENGEPAYLIPTFKYGKKLDNPLEEFRKTGDHLGGPFKTWQEADEWETNVRHPYVEKRKKIPSPAPTWGKDYRNGGEIMNVANKKNPIAKNGWLTKYDEEGNHHSALNGTEMSFYQQGQDWQPKGMGKDGIKVDNLGYWNKENWGKPVQINSPYITMKGIEEPLLGVSNIGEKKMMMPGKDYLFKGKKVTEYPIAKYGINEVHELTDFTNKPSKKRWLNKYA
jgi:hypothetical protein